MKTYKIISTFVLLSLLLATNVPPGLAAQMQTGGEYALATAQPSGPSHPSSSKPSSMNTWPNR